MRAKNLKYRLGLKGTPRPKPWCVELLDELGLYIAQLAVVFRRDLRDVEDDVGRAVAKAEGHDLTLTDIDEDELDRI